jgi:cytochrome c6
MHSKFSLALVLLPILPVLAPAPCRADPTKESWTKHCAKCHGADGRGDTRVGRKQNIKSLVSPEQQAKLSDAAMLKAIADGARDTEGEEKMPAFKDKLSPEQQTALVAFIRNLKANNSSHAEGTR